MAAQSSKRQALRRSHENRPLQATIVIAIDGGIAEVASHSGAPCRVIIRDYDIDGAEPKRLARDPEGRRCFELEFELPNDD